MRSLGQRRLVSLGLFLVLAVSSSCIAGAEPASTPGRTTTSATEPVPAPDAPVGEVLEIRLPTPSRVPIYCGGLLDSDVLESALGVPERAIDLAPRRSLYSLESAAAAQAGVLSCEWVGRAADEWGQPSNAGMSVQVLPSAAAEFHAYGQLYRTLQEGWAKEYPQEPPVVSGLIGTDSLLSCDVSDPSTPVQYQYQSCWGSLEASDYWVEYRFSSRRPFGSSSELQTELGILVGEALRNGLDAAGQPLAMSALPAGSAGSWDSCAALEGDGELQRLAGSPTLTSRREYSGVEFDVELAALPQGPYQTCYWDQSAFPDDEHYPYSCDDCPLPDGWVEPPVILDEVAFLSVSMLPGGAWAWQELIGQTPRLDAEAIALMGAQDGSSACGAESGGWCEIYAVVDHSVVRIQFSYYGDEPETVDSTPRAVQIMRYVISQLNY